VLIVYLLHLTF